MRGGQISLPFFGDGANTQLRWLTFRERRFMGRVQKIPLDISCFAMSGTVLHKGPRANDRKRMPWHWKLNRRVHGLERSELKE